MPHSFLHRGQQIHHVTAFDAMAETKRQIELTRFELQYFRQGPELSPDEKVLASRDWMQHLVGLERPDPNWFGYLVVSTWVARQ